jgi:hypothetical protein
MNPGNFYCALSCSGDVSQYLEYLLRTCFTFSAELKFFYCACEIRRLPDHDGRNRAEVWPPRCQFLVGRSSCVTDAQANSFIQGFFYLYIFIHFTKV